MRMLRQIGFFLIAVVLAANAVSLPVPLAMATLQQDGQMQSDDHCSCNTSDCAKAVPSCLSIVCVNACVGFTAAQSPEPHAIACDDDIEFALWTESVHPLADRPPPLPPPIA